MGIAERHTLNTEALLLAVVGLWFGAGLKRLHRHLHVRELASFVGSQLNERALGVRVP